MIKKIFAVLFMLCLLMGCSNTQLKGILPENIIAATNPEDFLTDSTYKSIVIEVIQVGNAEPYTGDFDYVVSHVTPFCNKPLGIKYVIDKPIPYQEVTTLRWKDADLFDFESKYAQLNSNGSILVVHYLYVHGVYYDGGLKINARQIGPYTVAFFHDVFGQYLGISPIVALHEFGHLMGLVNHGTPARYGHEDSSHLSHCNDVNCVMYWENTGTQSDFCDYCKSDLRNANK